ncbi:MAG: hypothetical protein ACXV2G_06810 [Actinomycetes bacterium]
MTAVASRGLGKARRTLLVAALLPTLLLGACTQHKVDPAAPDWHASARQAHRWVHHWCSVAHHGLPRAKAIELMGKPTQEFTGTNAQLHWAGDQYDFTAFLDPDSKVSSVTGDYDAVSEDDLATMVCATDDGTKMTGGH